MFQISLLDLTDIDTLTEQLIGVDVAYFEILLHLLKGVEKKDVTAEFVSNLIDQCF
jgi:hypothetical protein